MSTSMCWEYSLTKDSQDCESDRRESAMQHTSTVEQIPTTGIYAAMRRGHRDRTGHHLAGHLVIDSHGVARVVRTCCS